MFSHSDLRARNFLKFILMVVTVILPLSLTGVAEETKSTKKGCCGANAQVHKQVGATWFYSWWQTGGAKNPGLEFVPMIKGKANLGEKPFQQIRAQKNIKYLLGYNEPERKKQGNLTVAEGLKHWPRLVKLAEEMKVPLGSPAVSSDAGGLKWLDEFMEGAKKQKLRVDFVAVHWYGGTDIDRFEKFIDTIYKKYRKPIWVTEFNGWSGTHEEMEEFAIKGFKMLEKHRRVVRYAYFSKKKGEPGSLWDKDGSLSKIGLALQAQ